MNPTKPPRLSPTVRKLGWISFLTDVASEMVYPVIPLFVVGVLGLPVVVLGSIEGVAEGIVNVMNGLSGWQSDRSGRRLPLIRWGYGLAAASKPLLALAFHWPVVLFARSLDRVGKGLRSSARDALIADGSTKENLGRGFGFHRAMDTAGALTGVLLSALLLRFLPQSYRMIFVLAVLPGIAAVWLAFRLREAAPRPAATLPRPSLREWFDFPASYWRTLALFLLFALANSSDTLLLLRAKSVGLADSTVILAYAIYNLTYAAISYPAGIVSDRLGRWRVIALGWGIYAAVYFGFAKATMITVFPLFALYGCYIGLVHGVGKALIAENAPADRRGTAMGLFQMSTGLTTVVSSVVAGLLWDKISPAAPFYFGSAVAVLALLLIPFLSPSNSPLKSSSN
ncbi:MAG: MFS transporter [Pseudomonadota bacterium]